MKIEVLAGAGQVHLRKETFLSVKGGYVGCEYQRGAFRRSGLLEDRSGFRIADADQRRHSGLENTGFLESDFRTGGAQQRAVVQAYGCHHRQHGSDNVGAVQTTAQADFNYCGIHILAGEPPEGHARCNLKERQSVEVLFIQVQELPDFLSGYHFETAVRHDFHPFSEIQQMWRGIQPDCGGLMHADGQCRDRAPLVGHGTALCPSRMAPGEAAASGGQCRSEHAADAAFAVGSGNVNARILLPRISEQGAETRHAGKPRLVGIACESDFLHRLEPRIQSVQALIIIMNIKNWLHLNSKIIIFEGF